MPREVSKRRRRTQGGSVMFLAVLMLLFIVIPMVGLAIDASLLYTIKANLQTAADGAAQGW